MRPARTGVHDGLAFALWLPANGQPAATVIIVHGAGSSQESHYDFARAATAAGFAALTFDQRGHGQSEGSLDERAVMDIVAMSELARSEHPVSVALRGSSLGGYLVLRAAARARAAAVVAICPATSGGLRRALRSEMLRGKVDREGFEQVLGQSELSEAVARLDAPILLLHAQGDEQVPVEHSRELAGRAQHVRLVEVPGGHHRSVQHDDELQAVSLRFLEQSLGLRSPARARSAG